MRLSAFFALFLLYQLLKLYLYDLYPASDFDLWVARDSMMNYPRALVGSLALACCLRWWGKEATGLHGRGAMAALAVLLLHLGVQLTDGVDLGLYGLSHQAILALSSLFVAFNEELLFRGLGLQALRERYGDRWSLWLSTFLFTAFHFGAQPLAHWPGIFLIGLLYARMRLDGVSLVWLIFIHFAYDALWFTLGGDQRLFANLVFPPLFAGVYWVYLRLLRKAL